MRLSELRKLLHQINSRGFVPSARQGPTGIGHTLEGLLGLEENNLPIPDIGGRVEVKATRTSWSNLITLFTFNRAVWRYKPAEIIDRWGYVDDKGRKALYSTVSTQRENGQGLKLSVSDDAGELSLSHVSSGTLLAVWDMYHVIGTFQTKFRHVLLVHADTRMAFDKEEFHFNSAQVLSDPSARIFKMAFEEGKVVVDIRMHVNLKGSVRNHGTGFRIMENDLPALFGKIDRLV